MIVGMNSCRLRALRKRVVLVLLVLLLGGSGDAGGGRAAGGAGRRAAGVRNGDVEKDMASVATVLIDDEVSLEVTRSARRQPGLFLRLRGGQTSLNRLPAPRGSERAGASSSGGWPPGYIYIY